MVQASSDVSTGLPELDDLLRGLMAGDNVVWQVEKVEDYLVFVEPFCRYAATSGRRLVYFRFARHEPLLSDDIGAETLVLDPQAGFETFLDGIHGMIERAGRGAFYVFDCLSELAADWFSDQMLGNFFRLTCPYLYDLETVAYFTLLRNYHSFHATTPIRETTQLLLDIYHHGSKIYVRPLKVQQRYSPTMHMLHVWEDSGFQPVSDSCTISEILTSSPRSAFESAIDRLDVWSRTFLQAEEGLRYQPADRQADAKTTKLFHRLLRIVVSRDQRVLELAQRYFTLSDVLDIGKRTIGTGLIGGKSVGMLLARAILNRAAPRWGELLEVHDSFYIASDVFYTFLVRNGCWWIREDQKNTATFLKGAEQARRRILAGSFPKEIERQFAEMLDYFGQAPIIVRSSSLLEDNFGNSFAGKYESVFCPNRGSRHQRLENFVSAVKTIYASSMSEEALSYRARHGLLDLDEQMALLVQRVSGSFHSHLFYPQVAGVGFSFNPYVWSEYIDPHAGLLRLVFGLGTRAVDRSDDDYTRIVALNAPERRPEAERDNIQQYAQQKVDVLDLGGNQLVTADFNEVVKYSPDLPVTLFASRDIELARLAQHRAARDKSPLALTFEGLFSRTSFVKDMRDLLRILEEAYDYPVDIEFTANFLADNDYKLNLLQCRPLQVKGGSVIAEPPSDISEEDTLLETAGPVIGQSRLDTVARLIYVVPPVYAQLPIRKQYSVARLIGRLTHLEGPDKLGVTMLLGPGRWGTTTPSLGVPVSFAEIDTISMLCEIVAMRDDLVPDVSLGTHFFSELVEMDILYLALFPNQKGNVLNEAFFEEMPNKLPKLLPHAAVYSDVVKVIDPADCDGSRSLKLNADTFRQKVVCYFVRQNQ